MFIPEMIASTHLHLFMGSFMTQRDTFQPLNRACPGCYRQVSCCFEPVLRIPYCALKHLSRDFMRLTFREKCRLFLSVFPLLAHILH